MRNLRVWLDATGIGSGPVFRGVDRHGNMAGTALSPRSVSKILKRAARRAQGLIPTASPGTACVPGWRPPPPFGGAQEREVALTTGHKSDAMVRRYIREAELASVNMTARLGL